MSQEPLKWNFPTEPTVKSHNRNEAQPVVEECKALMVIPQPKTTPDRTLRDMLSIQHHSYQTLEIIPSKMTSNDKVQWLMADFSRLYRPLSQRIQLTKDCATYEPEMGVIWEILYTKDSIRFFFTIPDKDFIREGLSHSIRKCWAQSTVSAVANPIPAFEPKDTDVTRLTLKYNSVLALDTSNQQFSPLDTLLNTKHYLGEGDYALLQIMLCPYGENWQSYAKDTLEQIKKAKGLVPRKRGQKITKKEVAKTGAWGVGVVLEELLNVVGDVFIPGWVEDKDLFNSRKQQINDISQHTVQKARKEAFKTTIRMAVSCKDSEQRKAILRAVASAFDPLAGNNEFIEVAMTDADKDKELQLLKNRKFIRSNDILCSTELARMINLPDRRAQVEHAEELKVASHRAETPVPKEVFKPSGIPFAVYADVDGLMKTVYFPTDNVNLLCMTRVFVGEPGTGKTTAGVNFALEAFLKGYGATYIDAADGVAIQRLLSMVPPEKKDKVVILDFKNRRFPIGLGMAEAFTGEVEDAEEVIAEEIVNFIELNSGNELSMTSKRWIELASRTVFRRPTATFGDMLRVLRDREYCAECMENITDRDIIREWATWWNMADEQRDKLFNSAFYRIYKLTSKSLLKNIFMQPPKTGEDGMPLFNFRKWMDEGYLVLIKVNESLREENVTAIVSFILAKYNLAVISREDIPEKDRRPAFLLLDEPDHYIKGSERWRNFLTRYRKYHVGLTFMFHGWEQLKEADRELPKMMQKAGPHYVIFNTDQANLESLRFVYEPEYEMREVAKGIPQHHAIIRLKMYDKEGGVTPAFMAKAIGNPEDRYATYDNDHLYDDSAEAYGRPRDEVEDMIQELNAPEVTVEEEEELLSRPQRRQEEEERPRHGRQIRPSSRPRDFRSMGRGELNEFDD